MLESVLKQFTRLRKIYILLGIIIFMLGVLVVNSNEMHRRVAPDSHPEVAAIQKLGDRIDALNKTVANFLAVPAVQPQSGVNTAGLQSAISGLEQQVGKLAENAGAANPGMPWLGKLLAFGGFVFLMGRLIWRLEKQHWLVTLTLGGLTLIGTMSITFDGKIEMDSLFRFDNGGLKVDAGLPAKAMRDLGYSPSFDSGEVTANKESLCKPSQPGEGAWAVWFEKLAAEWNKTPNPKNANTLLILGSADRQPLNRQHARQYGSNEGLARARAEEVKKCLVSAINSRSDASHVIKEGDIMVVTVGPAYTPAVSSQTKQGKPDPNLAEDRKVRVWIDAPLDK